jgi:outer membrane protein TolC
MTIRFSISGALVLAALALTTPPSFAQTAWTVSQCLQEAFRNSRSLQMADYSLQSAQRKTLATKSQKYPTVGLSGLYTRIGKVTSFSIPMGMGGRTQKFTFGTTNRVNADIKLQIPLFTWGRIHHTIEMSHAGESLAGLQKKIENINLTDQVLRAFFAVLLNQEIIVLHERNVSRCEKQLDIARARYQAGQASQLDQLRSEVQLGSATSNLAESRDNLARSLLFLGKALGRTDTLAAVLGIWPQEQKVEQPSVWVEKAQRQRSELAVLQRQRILQEHGRAATATANKPNVFGFSGYNVQNGFDPMNPERFIDNYNFGVQLSVPLFDGFSTRHKVEEAEIELRKLQLQDLELRDVIQLQVRQAVLALHQTADKIAMQIHNVQLAQQTLAIAETQYRAGLVSSLDVIEAQQMLTQNEWLVSQARFNHTMARLDLCRAISDYSAFESSL